MKLSLPHRSLRFLLGLGLAFTCALRAQDPDPDAPLSQQQVDQLLGPIALYPDALVALILPASSTPGDVVLAARYLANGGDPDQIDNQPWTDSVKALAHYPVLVKWMDENLQWTRQLGSVFLNQPDDVMDSVQRLRGRARATGALTSTAQQKLVLDGDEIEIVPAQPDVIYVPYYDPNLVYGAQPGYYGPYLTFGLGLPVGFWLSYDFNWRRHTLLVGDRHHNWQEHRDWNRQPPSGGPNNGNWHPWQPPVARPPYARPDPRRPRPEIVAPKPFPGAPSNPRDQHARDDRPRPAGQANPPPLPTSIPQWKQDSRDNRSVQPPPAPRPEINPSPSNLPRPSGQGNQPPPLPANIPSGRQDSHDNRPGPQPLPPTRPEANPVPVNPPHQSDPTRQAPPIPTRQPPTRPEPRPANPPPPPQPKDGARDKDQEPPK